MTTQPKQLSAVDVTTPVFRASYPCLFVPKAPDPEQPQKKLWGVGMWFRTAETPESRAAGEEVVRLDALAKAANAAATAKWGPDPSKWPPLKHKLFKKGEENTGKNGPLAGITIVRCSRKEDFGAPVIVDQNLQPVIDVKAVYPGMYMRAKLHAYAWKHPTGGAGVSFTLDMVQLVRDGEPLGNHMDAADAFEPVPVPAAAPSAGAAQPKGAPAPADGGMFGALG